LTKRSQRSKHKALTFERRHDQLAPVPVFVKRLIASLAIAFALIAFALTIGIVGYHSLGKLDWVDSLLEASMILGGMGPVNQLTGDGVKIFASMYALFSGLIFIAVMGVVLSPIVHRFLHKFHVDQEDGQ
jgi:hypothetical protein